MTFSELCDAVEGLDATEDLAWAKEQIANAIITRGTEVIAVLIPGIVLEIVFSDDLSDEPYITPSFMK